MIYFASDASLGIMDSSVISSAVIVCNLIARINPVELSEILKFFR
jgi:hypothetical protein